VQVIGRDDHQQFHALIGRQCVFGGQHVLPGVIAALRRQPKRRTTALIVVGVAAERTADQFEASIETGGLPVCLGDEGAFTTADEAHSYFSTCCNHGNCLSGFMRNIDDVTGYIVGEI
jgi:hypothetical protein